MGRQERYLQRAGERGLKRVTVMVHEDDANAIRAMAESLRKEREQQPEVEQEVKQETEEWL